MRDRADGTADGPRMLGDPRTTYRGTPGANVLYERTRDVMTELTLQRLSDGLEVSGPPKSQAKPAIRPYGPSWSPRISPRCSRHAQRAAALASWHFASRS